MQNAASNAPATTTLSSEAGEERELVDGTNQASAGQTLMAQDQKQEEAPRKEAPADDPPAEEVPAEEAPAEEAPAEEAPAEEAPAEDTPAEEKPAEPVPEPPAETPAAKPEPEPAPTQEDEEAAIAKLIEGLTPEQLDEFMTRRDALNNDANDHRARRDDLNANTKKWAQKRDGLNAQVRELVDRANRNRAKRDEYNAEVHKAKAVRDELNGKAAEARNKLNEARANRPIDEGPSIARMKKKLRALEYEQMTKVLTPQKERALVDEITATLKIIKEKEKVLEADSASKGAWEGFQTARDAAEEAHKRVTELAELAQREHDEMVKLFESADGLRKEADGAQEEFVKSKVEADRVHREYIGMVNQIRDLEKIIVGLRQKDRKARREVSQAEAKADADAIYSKFLKGEKLSTEDLMTLQKAGFL